MRSAGDSQRELHEGAEQRLAAVSAHVEALAQAVDGRARGAAGRRRDDSSTRAAELRELARGIHPTALTSGGLGAALPELAARASLPVELRVDAGRSPPRSRRPPTSYARRGSRTSRSTHAPRRW